ncbi:lipopolysaccharide heptosyltransferase I [Campylobacter sp. LR264d]|uniref:lipopolysaccharide heptosyltransferase I n=1 Tax=unclassified Campylobacter TaxID=2593542 RepID=UPI00123A4D1C|nr:MULTISPECIES: lipopolysaccharide heptosyltransferase I [unclassified Campylobacter]KAA6225788.1 lipopolysaccharide heptosyltransferase I [Campylobacter sp. LR196d]KAA6230114.1 lipopolysaccharide heptosyltransferase I [Campylobacter sp. LR264d]
MKIAIVRLSALGDIIQSAIVLHFIKKNNPNIKIHWFIDEKFKEILENHPLIDKLYALPLKDKKIFKSFKILFNARKNKYNSVLDLQGLIKSALVSRILSRNSFGFDAKSLKESLAHSFYNQKLNLSYSENVYVRYLSLVAFALNADFEPKNIIFKQSVFEADESIKERLAKNLNLSQKNILIHVGSSVENKIYPKENLARLCTLLCDDKNIKIWLCHGSEKELNFSKEVLKLSMLNGQIEILPRLNLKELIALTRLVSLVIGNDSGPTHLAFAMNKPSITIFGPTPSARNFFKTHINKSINAGKKDIDAYHIDKNDNCIENINEKDIYDLAKEILYDNDR